MVPVRRHDRGQPALLPRRPSRQPGLRKPRHGGVYVVAHRGAHNGIPENSLPAYQKAIDLGADFVEIDLRTTNDGKFVSVHNATIDAYVGVLGIGSRPDAGRTAGTWTLVGASIRDGRGPEFQRFEEILELCQGKIGIYLDLKDGDVEGLAKIIQERHMEREVLWYTWPANIERLNRLCETCIGMPDPVYERNLPQLIEQLRPRVIAAVWKHYSPSFVETCHAAGAIVIVDESDPSCWEDALAWGSDGIQTDHPAKLIELLRSRRVAP